MPINIPSNLPALDVLLKENIFAIDSNRADSQNIRPLEVGILNLMPNKIETEIQILRLLSNTPIQINVDLIRIDETIPKNTPKSHMDAFYHEFSQVADKNYDGWIVTGAPLGLLEYEDVKYWNKMTELLDWARENVQSTMFLCWAAHAAMYHYYGVQRQLRDSKLSGVFEHSVEQPNDELMRGFDPLFWAPHSRVGEILRSDYESVDGLSVIAHSEIAGTYISATDDRRLVFVTGHPEYDASTLQQEYERDLAADLNPQLPQSYFINDDPQQEPMVRWKSHGSLLLTNWLNYYVYQNTPYDLTQLRRK
ncbi:homoserine O-succinyltransferase [Glaciecola sp. MH2013]|uniref:homoserine O-succinyltransferase n=1 Tax=Glaciecola sp. MH2013 TaxID=2785524 RepID=UPI00189CCD9A|nr:homoserine O-succinyltransferase [Glaciecola sp. MH2013]MBF7072398.1 homoserine O-succinyltransferase [Glaciecola sp. MH2013]